MTKVRLRELVRGVALGAVSDGALLEELEVSSISTDTRSLKRGDLFVALSGESHDGHGFVPDAVRKGASAVIYETGKADAPGIREGLESARLGTARGVLFLAVDSTRKCIGGMAGNYLRRFSLRKIAVTGSAGKTTTVRLVASVLGVKFSLVASPRSYNNDIGVPKTIFTVGEDTEVLVQEIGTNHPGEIAYLSGIVGQDCALITNIGPAHVGHFGSLAEIAREKRSAVEGLPEDGFAFLNAEDPCFEYLREGTAARVFTFGLERGDLFPERIREVGAGSVRFSLGGLDIGARLPGTHGILDAVSAALVGRCFGLSFEEVREGIEGYVPEGGRGDVHEIGGVTLIDESYNANPLSVAASLEHLGRIGAGGKRILVFADMLELGENAERYHGEAAALIVKVGVSRLLTFGELARAAGEACRDAGLRDVTHYSRVDELAARLKEDVEKGVVKSGDVILVKGSRAMRLDRVVRCLVGG